LLIALATADAEDHTATGRVSESRGIEEAGVASALS
jgi:hypothetical protein